MNRRSLLHMTATTAAGLVFKPRQVSAQTSDSTAVMNALSEYMSGAGTRPLPKEIVEHTKDHVLDTLASMISGSELLPGQVALRYLRAHVGKGPGTVAGTTLTATPIDAALANGVMAHADETDDSHNRSRSHPGCAVVPAALAAGEAFGIDGKLFLRAVTLGYEIGPRVVMAMMDPFHNENSLSTHSIAGTFGAAAAAGCAAGLDGQRMRWLLDYAAQQSSGIWRRDSEHVEKAFVFAGMPARNGVTAALVVQSGWSGVSDIFSGADNFFMAYAPKAEPQRLVEMLGQRYEVTETDIKKWTVGSPIQAPLDAVDAMRRKNPFEADQVRRVTVRLAPNQAVVVDNRDIPDISLQHMIAVMLLDKTLSFRAAHDRSRMQDPMALHQREKVRLVHDEALSEFLPVRVASVEIELDDGTLLSERISAVRGTPRNPMSSAEVIEKARDLTTPVLGHEKAERLIETVYALENVSEVRKLGSLLHGNHG